jgi:hypothetical protein
MFQRPCCHVAGATVVDDDVSERINILLRLGHAAGPVPLLFHTGVDLVVGIAKVTGSLGGQQMKTRQLLQVTCLIRVTIRTRRQTGQFGYERFLQVTVRDPFELSEM